MAWEAVAFVKKLSAHADGAPLTRCEKLVLFVLADYYNAKLGYAMPGHTAIARDCLISRRYVITLLARLKQHGTLEITPRLHNTNLYRITGFGETAIQGSEHSSLVNTVHLGKSARIGSELASSPKPKDNHKNKTPLPPTDAGGSSQQFSPNGNLLNVVWCGQLISVDMGRRKRLPSLEAYHGARAEDVVLYLCRKGFSAKIVSQR